MSLSVGIVGLPNVGKSTLFNALRSAQGKLTGLAQVGDYPFTTIEPNVGIVDVPDSRLEKLAEFVRQTETVEPSFRIVPATVQFYDIAGLVKGAHKGEGLGNQFLSHIREVDMMLHVVRAFSDPSMDSTSSPQASSGQALSASSTNPDDDIATINTELLLADLATATKMLAVARNDKKSEEKTAKQKVSGLEKIVRALEAGFSASSASLSDEEKTTLGQLPFLTAKPVLLVYNTNEANVKQSFGESSITICAKLEVELAALEPFEQQSYLESLGLTEPGLDRIIRRSYEMLGLISFFTAGPKEIRAWTVTKGTKAPQAAGVIHSDFERLFIRGQVIGWKELVDAGSLRVAKEKGLVAVVGKDYIMSDGDVVEFLVGR